MTWRNLWEWGRVACIRNPGTTLYSKMSHQFHTLYALLLQKELLVSIRIDFRAGLDGRLTRKVAVSVTKWNHAYDSDNPDLKEFLIYSEAFHINLNGETNYIQSIMVLSKQNICTLSTTYVYSSSTSEVWPVSSTIGFITRGQSCKLTYSTHLFFPMTMDGLYIYIYIYIYIYFFFEINFFIISLQKKKHCHKQMSCLCVSSCACT